MNLKLISSITVLTLLSTIEANAFESADCSKFLQGGGMSCKTFQRTPTQSQLIAMKAFHEFCGDVDGCHIRLFAIAKDGAPVAASGTTFFIPGDNQNWSSGANNAKDGNGVAEIIIKAGHCRLLDGLKHLNGSTTDAAGEFSLVTSKPTVLEDRCYLSVVD